MNLYRRQPTGDGVYRHDGSVIQDDEGRLHFRCPCGRRPIALATRQADGGKDTHSTTINADGVLSVHNSIGSHADSYIDGELRPSNWCHFTIRDGKPYRYTDSQCPLDAPLA